MHQLSTLPSQSQTLPIVRSELLYLLVLLKTEYFNEGTTSSDQRPQIGHGGKNSLAVQSKPIESSSIAFAGSLHKKLGRRMLSYSPLPTSLQRLKLTDPRPTTGSQCQSGNQRVPTHRYITVQHVHYLAEDDECGERRTLSLDRVLRALPLLLHLAGVANRRMDSSRSLPRVRRQIALLRCSVRPRPETLRRSPLLQFQRSRHS